MEPQLTQQRLMQLFEYQKAAGVFIRKIGTGGCAAGTIAGYTNSFGYVCIAVDGREYRRSHLVWLAEHGELPGGEIDHKDRRRNNDTIHNLRKATRKQNRWNTNAKNIYWRPKARKFEVQVNNKYLGRFSTLNEAKQVVANATAYRGEFSSHQ